MGKRIYEHSHSCQVGEYMVYSIFIVEKVPKEILACRDIESNKKLLEEHFKKQSELFVCDLLEEINGQKPD